MRLVTSDDRRYQLGWFQSVQVTSLQGCCFESCQPGHRGFPQFASLAQAAPSPSPLTSDRCGPGLRYWRSSLVHVFCREGKSSESRQFTEMAITANTQTTSHLAGTATPSCEHIHLPVHNKRCLQPWNSLISKLEYRLRLGDVCLPTSLTPHPPLQQLSLQKRLA